MPTSMDYEGLKEVLLETYILHRFNFLNLVNLFWQRKKCDTLKDVSSVNKNILKSNLKDKIFFKIYVVNK